MNLKEKRPKKSHAYQKHIVGDHWKIENLRAQGGGQEGTLIIDEKI